MSAIARLNPAGLFDPSDSHYSHVSTVTSGTLAFVSGQVAWMADGTPVPSSLKEQPTSWWVTSARASRP